MPLIQPFGDEAAIADPREDVGNLSAYPTLIEERDAGICWNLIDANSTGKCLKWHDFKVINYKTHLEGNLNFYEFEAWCKSGYKSGAAAEGWLENKKFNCYALFLQAIDEGRMPSGNEFREILLQFSKIRQCEWARSMLAILRAN